MPKQNLQLERGKTYEMSYVHPSAMTGGTVYFTVKSAEYDTDGDDSDAPIAKTITSFSTNDTVAAWTLTDADTYKTPGKYHYDIVYKNASGKTLPASWYGEIKISGQPTNRNVT